MLGLEKLKKGDGFFLFGGIWLLYFVLSPFYVFQSGLPQPADIIIFGGILVFLAIGRMYYSRHVASVYVFGLIFVGLTASINLIHFHFIADIKFIMHSLFYAFNFGIFLYVVNLFAREPVRMNRYTYIALSAVILIQFIAVQFFPDTDDFRASGTFNKSNQLAYWCVLSASLLLILKRNKQINFIDIALFSILTYMQMLSLSKAGIVVFFVLFIIFLAAPQMPKTYRVFLVFIISLLIISNLSNSKRVFEALNRVETIEAVSQRLNTIGKQSDDTPEARGYLRLVKHPEYLFVGAGEGAYWRFGRQELHSGIATLVFSYSIFGFSVFLLFLGNIFFKLPWYYTAMLVPIFLYGLTHQNIRFSYFWVFLACAYSGHFYAVKERVASTTENKLSLITRPAREASNG